MRTAVRTDPAVIRQVLATSDETTAYEAAKRHGVHAWTVMRWAARRDEIGPGWPTDQDIADWRRDQAENGPTRAAKSAVEYEYRKKVYLNRGNLQVPSLGTTRRLRALAAIGWTQAEIATRMGCSPSRVGHLMRGVWEKCYPDTVDTVNRVYTDLCMTVPTDPPTAARGATRIHERARTLARRAGYFPPFAWENIDDPDETPTRGEPDQRDEDDVDEVVVERVLAGEYRLAKGTTRAEKEAIVAGWMATGRAEKTLCNQLGWRQGRYRPHLEETA